MEDDDAPQEFDQLIDHKKMRILCETDHKIIYIYNDETTVRIFHSHSMDFNRHYTGDIKARKCYYDSIIASYKLAESKLNGKLIDQGQFEPEKYIVYDLPYTGQTVYDLIVKQLKISDLIEKDSKISGIIDILESQLPNIITQLVNNKIIHNDIAFRNLTISLDGQLNLIDLNEIGNLGDHTEIKYLFTYLKEDFKWLEKHQWLSRGQILIDKLKLILVNALMDFPVASVYPKDNLEPGSPNSLI